MVMPLIALPDESFLEAIEVFVPAADSLFWDDKISEALSIWCGLGKRFLID